MSDKELESIKLFQEPKCPPEEMEKLFRRMMWEGAFISVHNRLPRTDAELEDFKLELERQGAT